MSRPLEAVGLSVDVPEGWEAEIDTGAGEQPVDSAMDLMPRLHMANYPLPEVRGDFGSGATEQMRRGEAFICLLEEDPAMAATRLYAAARLPTFTADDFNPHQMQRPIAGQSGAQAFFQIRSSSGRGSVDGKGASKAVRAFVMYVVVGDHLGRATVLDQINNIVASLRFD